MLGSLVPKNCKFNVWMIIVESVKLDFLYKNFYSYEHSNQTARLCRTAKSHKFENLKDIIIANLKFRPIIRQTGTFKYNATKVMSII